MSSGGRADEVRIDAHRVDDVHLAYRVLRKGGAQPTWEQAEDLKR
jgi:hypothetical protein